MFYFLSRISAGVPKRVILNKELPVKLTQVLAKVHIPMTTMLLSVLENLNRIGRAINQIGAEASENEHAVLQQIVESAIQVIPGSAAVIFTYNEAQKSFDPQSRVSAGEFVQGLAGEKPRPKGFGFRAIEQKRPILSYEEVDLDIDPVKRKQGAQTLVCFPLIVAREPVGVLYVYLKEERRFTRLELLMLENFTNQAAMALYQAHHLANVSRDLARKEEQMARLQRASMIISSRLRLEETLEAILQMALEVTNAQYGIFRLLDPVRNVLVTRAYAGEGLGHPFVQELPLDQPSISAWVVKNRQSVLIPDLTAQPWSKIYFPLDANLSMKSELAVPLISSSGRLEGVLNLESPRKNAFSEEDRLLLQSLATHAVIAIHEVRLLDALQEISQLLLTQPEEVVLKRLVSLAKDLLDSLVCGIWMLDEQRLILRVAESEEKISLKFIVPEISEILNSEKEIFQIPAESFLMEIPQELPASAWVVPIGSLPEYGAGGILLVYPVFAKGAENEWEKKVLSLLAHYAEMAIFFSSHQKELRQAQEQRSVAEMFAAVGDIATNLLHQLNNKIGTIPVRIQSIQDRRQELLSQDPYLSNHLEEIERSATEAMRIVRKNLSHLHPVQIVPVNLATCIQEAIQMANLGAEIEVQVENLQNLPEIAGAQYNLALAFANLLENASHAMEGRGKIIISGSQSSSWVEVVVRDFGPGIPPEMHQRIFELNFSSGSPSHAGKLGFGLYWVKALMIRLGGSVDVESDGMSGTAFRLRFPLRRKPL